MAQCRCMCTLRKLHDLVILYLSQKCSWIVICSRTAKNRMTDEEKKMLDRSQSHMYEDMRQAAEAHRQASHWFNHFCAERIPRSFEYASHFCNSITWALYYVFFLNFSIISILFMFIKFVCCVGTPVSYYSFHLFIFSYVTDLH